MSTLGLARPTPMEGLRFRFPKTPQEMKILVAEDERPARTELVDHLSSLLPQAQILEAKDGLEALAIATEGGFDVAFLDIEMPGLDGLAVGSRLLELKNPPRLVFATANAGHAVEAFRMAALDYVLKPFEVDRLKETVDRLMGDQEHSRRQRQAVSRYYESKGTPQIWAEAAEDSWVLLDFDSIYWVEAAERSVVLHSPSYPTLKVRVNLKEMEKKLEPHGFIRSHKAYLVNVSRVKRVRSWFSGSYVLVMGDAAMTEIPLSRRFASKFKEVTGFT